MKEPVRPVLMETFENGISVGHTKEFFEVAVRTDAALNGDLVSVRLTGVESGRLVGTLEGAYEQ